jgi:ABC-2 type transport system ATP-binding protein
MKPVASKNRNSEKGASEGIQDLEGLVRFEDAAKDYGTKKIGPLRFSVERGEIVGLLGPNGSGKSTSIRLMLGLMRPSSGAVSLMGLDPIRQHSKALKHVGYSPELPNLQTFLTPSELLELVGKELSLGRDELKSRVPEVLESVGLLAYSDYKIGKLSKGMIQRLSVAQATLGTPSLMILDEPMIGIDPAGVVHFRDLFRQFMANGGTIIMSSHIMSEVESLCNRVLLIHSGRLLFSGTIDRFIESSLGARIVHVELGEYREGLLTQVEKIAGVIRLAKTSGGLNIEVEKGVDRRSEISKVIVESGVALLSMDYSRSEFDEAYISAIKASGN